MDACEKVDFEKKRQDLFRPKKITEYVNDELIKQKGKVQWLGGSAEVAKAVGELIKPALEKLERHYEKLERMLKTGEVQATVWVKM